MSMRRLARGGRVRWGGITEKMDNENHQHLGESARHIPRREKADESVCFYNLLFKEELSSIFISQLRYRVE